jgi:Fe2+ transport system protein B
MLDTFHETLEKEDLLQYGILGMHWGVRRSTGQLQAVRGKKKWEEDGGGHVPLKEVTNKNAAQAAKARAKFDKKAAKNIKALSDEDRRKLLKRLEEEANVKRYVNQDKSQVQQVLENVVKQMGQKGLTTAGNAAMTMAAKKIAEKTNGNPDQYSQAIRDFTKLYYAYMKK